MIKDGKMKHKVKDSIEKLARSYNLEVRDVDVVVKYVESYCTVIGGVFSCHLNRQVL